MIRKYGFFSATLLLGWAGTAFAQAPYPATNDSGDTAPPIYGEKSVTVRTEGFSAGVLGGLRWNFSHSWGVGFSLRVDQWILPTQQACTPLGDCSTLSGGVLALGGGLAIGYRIPL